jgi:hypothetical protein
MSRDLFQHHPAFGYHFIPGIRARVEHEGGGYLLRANQAGFRCEHEFEPRKRPGVHRILLFGDSYTAGDGVSNKARYGDVLETLVPNLEVFNFGLPGTGTDQQYLAFREWAPRLEYDLAVIGVLVENIRRVVARYREFRSRSGERVLLAKPYFTLDAGALRLHNVPVPKEPIAPDELPPEEQSHVDRGGDHYWVRRVIGAFGPKAKELVQGLVGQNPLPAYDRPDDPAWLLLKGILTAWARETPTPVVVMPIPLYHYVEEISTADAYRARFRELAPLPNVTVHDPLPAFHAVPRGQRRQLRFATDIHPTPAAHRVLAESLASVIRPLVGSLPAQRGAAVPAPDAPAPAGRPE